MQQQQQQQRTSFSFAPVSVMLFSRFCKVGCVCVPIGGGAGGELFGCEIVHFFSAPFVACCFTLSRVFFSLFSYFNALISCPDPYETLQSDTHTHTYTHSYHRPFLCSSVTNLRNRLLTHRRTHSLDRFRARVIKLMIVSTSRAHLS